MLLPDQSGIAEGITSLGSALGDALKQRVKSQSLRQIMQPYQAPQAQAQAQAQAPQGAVPSDNQTDSTLGGVLDQNQPPAIPVADQIFNQKNAEIQYKKQQAAALEAEGYHPQAQMMMQDAHQQETMLQQERLQEKNLSQKVQLQKDQHAFKQNEPYFSDMEKKRTALENKELAILQIQNAMSKGETRTLRNFLAAKLPNEQQAAFLRSDNAQELQDAVKTFFLEDLKELPKGGRLNVVLEQNILGALQSPGKSRENNQKATEYQIYKNDVGKREMEVYDNLYDQYLKAGREPPANLKRQVDRIVQPYVAGRKKELAQTIYDIEHGKLKSPQMLNMPIAKEAIKDTPAKEGYTWIIDPSGNPVQAPNNQLDKWLNGGGKLIK